MSVHIIDISDFSDSDSGYQLRRKNYLTAAKGRMVIAKTDLIQRLNMGFDIQLSDLKTKNHYWNVYHQPFSHGILEEIYRQLGEPGIKRVNFQWHSGKDHKKSFMRKMVKKKTSNTQPVWLPEQNLTIPQVGNHFRVDEDWVIKVYRQSSLCKMFSEFYGENEWKLKSKDLIYGDFVDEICVLKDSTFVITSITKKTRGSFEFVIEFQKGSVIDCLSGGSMFLDQKFRFFPLVSDLHGLRCSLNKLSEV